MQTGSDMAFFSGEVFPPPMSLIKAKSHPYASEVMVTLPPRLMKKTSHPGDSGEIMVRERRISKQPQILNVRPPAIMNFEIIINHGVVVL